MLSEPWELLEKNELESEFKAELDLDSKTDRRIRILPQTDFSHGRYSDRNIYISLNLYIT